LKSKALILFFRSKNQQTERSLSKNENHIKIAENGVKGQTKKDCTFVSESKKEYHPGIDRRAAEINVIL
jgi:hypothetical protein